MNHTVHILHYFHLRDVMQIMKPLMFALMLLLNALRIEDMRVLQVVVWWYSLMDSACPYNLSLNSWDTYTPAMKSIYTTTQRSSQKYPRCVIHAFYRNQAIKITLCALASLDGKLYKCYTNWHINCITKAIVSLYCTQQSPKLHTNTPPSTPEKNILSILTFSYLFLKIDQKNFHTLIC